MKNFAPYRLWLYFVTASCILISPPLPVSVLAPVSAQESKVSVRGQIYSRLRNMSFPGADVRFCHYRHGCAGAKTDHSGMYYMVLSPGPHEIYVNGIYQARQTIPSTPEFEIRPLPGD